MTIGTITTKGTRLYFVAPPEASSSGDGVILHMECATGVTGLGGASDQIDITCLDSEEKEFEQGMANPSPISVPFNLIPRSAAHQGVVALHQSGVKTSWMLCLSDCMLANGAPVAVDSDGRLVSVQPTNVEFLGYVSDVNIDVATNEIVRGTLTVQRSGAAVFTWPAPE